MTNDRMARQPENPNRPWKRIYILILTGAVLWCAALVLTPFWSAGHQEGAFWMRLFFSGVCHQNPERSLTLADRFLPVCARCTGIYFGFLIGTAGFPLLRKRLAAKQWPWRIWFACALLLGALEWTVSKLDWFTNLWLRSGTGLILGMITALCALQGLSELFFKPTSERGHDE